MASDVKDNQQNLAAGQSGFSSVYFCTPTTQRIRGQECKGGKRRPQLSSGYCPHNFIQNKKIQMIHHSDKMQIKTKTLQWSSNTTQWTNQTIHSEFDQLNIHFTIASISLHISHLHNRATRSKNNVVALRKSYRRSRPPAQNGNSSSQPTTLPHNKLWRSKDR